MHWLAGLLGNRPHLPPLQQKSLAAWQKLPRTLLSTPFGSARCVVADVETSGLRLSKDRLISIGAVAVINGQIALGDSFAVVLQQATASHKKNILLHGIGSTAQTEGVPAAEALLAFLDFLRKDPLIGFHVTFDRTMIRRAMREYLGCPFKHPWVDMAFVMPSLFPALAARYRSLDDWITHFNISNDARHDALSDALVTAQLFQVAVTQARKMKIDNFSGMRDLEKARHWVNRLS